MASFKKVPNGYRADIARMGKRKSKTFRTKKEAQEWAARQEYLILNADDVSTTMTFGDMLERYAREVSPTKKGGRWEMIRIEKFQKDPIARISMAALRPSDFADWRDQRLREVAPGSVNREMVLMSSALNVARRDWGLIKVNPLADVRKPSKPPPRDRLVTPDELERLRFSAGDDLTRATARAFHAFLFSIETAMRAGEVCGLTWANVDLDRRVARLLHTKNGHPRDVPLSSEAVRLLQALPPADPVFGLKPRQLDALWRKLRDRAGVVGLTYHDSRASAISRLSKKLDVLTLARMVGHKDIKMLMTYYRTPADQIAKLLD